jgi:hypothetical protein
LYLEAVKGKLLLLICKLVSIILIPQQEYDLCSNLLS